MDAIRAHDVALAGYGLAGGGAAALVWARSRRITALTVAAAGLATAALVEMDGGLPEGSWRGTWVVALVAIVAYLGARSLPRVRPSADTLVLLALLVSAVATWSAVPETSAILPVGGAVAGLAVIQLVARGHLQATAVALLSGAIAAGACRGSAPSDLRLAGAVASLGLFLWWPIGRGLREIVDRRHRWRGVLPGPWPLGAHAVLALLAARWVGAAQDATAGRLVVIGVIGVVVSALCRPRATMDP